MMSLIKCDGKTQFSKVISVLLKPTDMCNLRCKYCFQQDKGYAKNKLSAATLKKFCDITFPHYDSVGIVFHGGEPTFFGKSALQRYVDILKYKAKEYGVKMKLSMQSNGTLLDVDFVKYLKNEQIHLGISFDGLHNDETRHSTQSVLNSLSLLKKYDLKVGVITVVTDVNCHDLIENYEYMKKLGTSIKLSAFEDCVDNRDIGLDINKFISSMKKFFDYWYNDETCNIGVDPFEAIIKSIILGYSNQCSHSSCLSRWMCLEPNGDVTPCDRFFPKEYTYGNVMNMSDIRQIYESEGFLRLLTGSIKRRTKCKQVCKLYQYCEGGCNNEAMCQVGLENNCGTSCMIFKELFNYIKYYIQQHSFEIKNPKVSLLVEHFGSFK